MSANVVVVPPDGVAEGSQDMALLVPKDAFVGVLESRAPSARESGDVRCSPGRASGTVLPCEVEGAVGSGSGAARRGEFGGCRCDRFRRLVGCE